MADLDHGDRAKRWRQWQRRWEHGEVMAVEGDGTAWFLPDGRKRPSRVDASELRPEDGRTTTTGRVERRFTRERPDRDDEPTVQQKRDRSPRPSYLAWIRQQPCCAPGCGVTPCDPHHWPRKQQGNANGDDLLVVPLCRFHHDRFEGKQGAELRNTLPSERGGSMSAEETHLHLLDVQRHLLARWVRMRGMAA